MSCISLQKINLFTQTILVLAFSVIMIKSIVKFSSKETGTKFTVENNPYPKLFPSLSIFLCPLFYENKDFGGWNGVTLSKNHDKIKDLPQLSQIIFGIINEDSPGSYQQ